MKRYLLLLFFIEYSFFSYSQDFSNKGKDFWVAYGYHQVMNVSNFQMEILGEQNRCQWILIIISLSRGMAASQLQVM